MYVPSWFEETDRDKLFDFVEANSFGLLVSQLDGQMFATHLPVLVDRGGDGQLLAHMARANPQWTQLAGQEVLAVFSGPHAYISPTWYGTDNVVPTWNYVAVHVYGKCEIIEDEQETARIVERYVSTYERSMSQAWTIDSKTPFFQKLVKMVVGFRVQINRVEGKWKLGQNHPVAMRVGAANHLAESASQDAQAIASLMRASLPS